MTTVTQNPVNSFVRRDQTLDHLRVTTQLDVPLLNVTTVNTVLGPNQPLGSIFYDVATGVLYISQGSAATNLVPSSVLASYVYGAGQSSALTPITLTAGAGNALPINNSTTPTLFPTTFKSSNVTAAASFAETEVGTYIVDYAADINVAYGGSAVTADNVVLSVQMSTTSASASFATIGQYIYQSINPVNVTVQFPLRGRTYINLPTAAPSSTIWLRVLYTTGGTASDMTVQLVSNSLNISRVV